ncbi:hypothetical protein ABT282_07215 [Streptomyces sp. NPDC000927]|uniref:hypothetical protein n=1 Tax=Streptomyces sp. NPDC000927 TaxID=3154371 RepID=UPI00332DC18A
MKIDHYIVHSTVVDPEPDSTYGTSPVVTELATAMAQCRSSQKAGRRAFITARDKDSNILHVIATAEYPAHGVQRFSDAIFGGPDQHTPDAVRTFADKMDWTS